MDGVAYKKELGFTGRCLLTTSSKSMIPHERVSEDDNHVELLM